MLVFADREKSSTTKLIEGEVFEDYIDTKNENKGVFLPDPSIMLLDASDFYDVVGVFSYEFIFACAKFFIF